LRTDDSAANPLSEGLDRRKPLAASTVVLFGASGDLTERKLIPALYHLEESGLLPPRTAIVGAARRAWSDESFRDAMREAIRRHARGSEPGAAGETAGEARRERFAGSLFYQPVAFDDPAAYQALAARLEEIERRLGLPGNRLFYLATSPRYFAPIVQALAGAGLVRPPGGGGPWSRVVVEKPVGHDLESARALNAEILSVLAEDQVFRIDHYLGKETVQNLLALRFANGIFEPLWNRKYIDHVQITVAESIGVEGRGGYYDGAGALRDMVQNHLLQVLSLVAMEPPGAMEADTIRDEKVKVLRALREIPRREIDRHAVRGQYAAGTILGEPVPGYLEEEGVPQESATETYVALRLHIDSWRWAEVPFFLRCGKRLPKRTTEIAIRFKKPPLPLFGAAAARTVAPNTLIVNVQPDEGISLCFGAKVPGPDLFVRQVKMDFRYGTSFAVPSPEAYERLLLDALGGDSTLFTRRDEVEAQWTFITEILEAWKEAGSAPFPYAAGTWGPPEADVLLDGLEGEWRRL
jgi:glucose-6-phosphate 1-dehydrogenase